MGGKKGRSKPKTDAIFKVAGHKALKAKRRTKPLVTNLKKIGFQTRELVTKSNEQLVAVLKARVEEKMSVPNDKPVEQPKKAVEKPVEMDETVEQIQRLWR